MSKRIILTCAGGFSTSMLVEKMKEEISNRGLDFTIDACGEGILESYLPADVVLIGPQLSHAENDVKEKVGPDVPVSVIDMLDYGMMNGENVLNLAIEMMETK